jgi:4-hydroxy-tetrahydrodipicolinate synthase
MQPLSPLWTGTWTALITPMSPTGALDLDALRALCEAQIQGGVSGLVACGTTGEAATLTEAERGQVIGTVVAAAAGRVPVMAGAGTQATRSTLEAVKAAEQLGASGALVVTPYYNKPTPTGLLRHFEEVAEGSALPLMLYNVPSRTGCDLKPETVVALSRHPRIIGVKDATGDLGRLDAGLGASGPEFAWLSGDDNTACAFVLMGGHGVISVASNLLPKDLSAMVGAAQAGDARAARARHYRLTPILAALGLETNPLPIKTALALRHQVTETFRLPLCAMQPDNRERLARALSAL